MKTEEFFVRSDDGLKSMTIDALGKLSSRNMSRVALLQACIDACLVHKTIGYVQFLKAEEADFSEQDGVKCLCFEFQFSEQFCQSALEIGCLVNTIKWRVALPLEIQMEVSAGKPTVFDMLDRLEILLPKNLNIDVCTRMIKAVIENMAT